VLACLRRSSGVRTERAREGIDFAMKQPRAGDALLQRVQKNALCGLGEASFELVGGGAPDAGDSDRRDVRRARGGRRWLARLGFGKTTRCLGHTFHRG
jgi:hypothetical protein